MATTLTSPTVKKYSLGMRLWHWGNAFLITAQLVTILFISVIVNTKSLRPEFQQAFQKTGGSLSEQQARSLAHIVSERIWDWHVYFGLALAAFLVFRIVLTFVQPAAQSFRTRFREARQEGGTALFAKYTYIAFYLFLVVQVATGLALVYGDNLGLARGAEHTIKEIHEVNMYLIIAYTVLHIVGVVRSEIVERYGPLGSMIHGRAVGEERL
ncbi:cytochrome b/b6 domain-containing protein [Hymenobacter sp. BT507]|uniref:Cytochrome b/b6 domain-containing protein n=1 Tax=Hymenobacter citatus TaxID=2763506 RepID=A0ABR7MNN9_9BACT|nr:cytochrome b/b6 domain-containing protein [Hymenobacter citatus]MBC6612699.1 cytochrome b/b6 domain-containing protein [Hymenobacter citatus]